MNITLPVRTERSRIARRYGVRQTPRQIKRDIYQNLIDGARELGVRDPLSAITVIEDELTDGQLRVTFRGPSHFEVDYLLLVGATTKMGRSDQIGEKGEGLKISTLMLMRDLELQVAIRSGNHERIWTAVPRWEYVKSIDDDEMIYDIVEEETPGGVMFSMIELTGNSETLRDFLAIEIEELFASDRNKWLQMPLGCGIYAKPGGKDDPGRIFLAGVDRGPERSMTFIYRCDEKIPEDADRERQNLTHEGKVAVISKCFLSPLCPPTIFNTLLENKMSQVVASYTYDPEVEAFKKRSDYPEIWRKFVSHVMKHYSYSEHALTDSWEYTQLSRWGIAHQVKDQKLAQILRDEGIKSLEDRLDAHRRSTSVKVVDGSKYARKINLLREVFQSALLEFPRIDLFKPDTEEEVRLLGVYLGDMHMRMNIGLFEQDFAKALCVVAHERAHRAGDKHSEEFHDAFHGDMEKLFGNGHPYPGEHLVLVRKNTLAWNRKPNPRMKDGDNRESEDE